MVKCDFNWAKETREFGSEVLIVDLVDRSEDEGKKHNSHFNSDTHSTLSFQIYNTAIFT